MTIAFTIGGRDFTNFVDLRSVDVTDVSTAQGDQMALRCVMSASDLAQVGAPQGGQIVSFSVNSVKQFEGVILSTEQAVHQNVENYEIGVRASDFTFLLGKKLVNEKEFGPGTAGGLVRQLVAKYAPGFGTAFVRDGFPVPEEDWDHAELTGVIERYARAIGFVWYVDFDRQLHFSAGESGIGALSLIDLDQELRIGDVQITEDASQIANRVYVKDATSRSAEKRRDTFVASENQSFFKLFTPPFDADEVEVFRDGEPVTIFEDHLTTTDAELTGSHDTCYVCVLNSGIRFPLSDLPEEGDLIEVDYFPEESGGEGGIVITLEDPDSIRMMRQRESTTGFLSDGVHETTISVPDLRVRTLDPLAFVGSLLLDRTAWPEIRGSFTTVDPTLVSASSGWKPGQGIRLRSSKRNLYEPKSFWRTGMKLEPLVYVQSVQKTFRPYRATSGVTPLFQVQVKFTSTPLGSIL